MAPDRGWTVAVVVAGNVAFWLAVLARTWASSRSSDAKSAGNAVISRPPRSALVLRLVVATNLLYYAVALAWLVSPPLAGPALWHTTDLTAAIGAALMLAALGLIAWCFAVFRSWRIRAEIEEGHELMTGGPFALVRHPIYAGIIAFFAASFVLVPRAGFLVAALANVWAHDLRARTEEEALLDVFGSMYRRYMAHTRRLIPGVY
jgi:protein-S-isoprenylcysteine O-methyltransferase Ste14